MSLYKRRICQILNASQRRNFPSRSCHNALNAFGKANIFVKNVCLYLFRIRYLRSYSKLWFSVWNLTLHCVNLRWVKAFCAARNYFRWLNKVEKRPSLCLQQTRAEQTQTKGSLVKVAGQLDYGSIITWLRYAYVFGLYDYFFQ